MAAEQQLTDWFLHRDRQKPARVGCYETRFAEGTYWHAVHGFGRPGYRWWDGSKWSLAVLEPARIGQALGTAGVQSLDWRGLAQDPEAA